MNHTQQHFDREQLQRLLNDSLPEPQSGVIAAHVADCVECRRALESLAATPEWWTNACRDAGTILHNPAAYQSSADGQSQPAVSSLSDESFASDFAVDFLAPSEDPTMLGRLGDCEIVEIIGRGGMGIVFKGFQKELHRCVAVKVLAPHLALSAAARRRFEREAQATAAVVHPHVMAIHSVATNTRLPYLVMPYVNCESLQQRLDRHGPLDLKDVLRIGMQAALGLSAAHAQGLVHRDIKPANILLETNVDRVMLTDFGLARAVDDATLTRTGIIAGTPQYMSPEQANGDAIDCRSDLFSLGSVIYAISTARPPFRAETTFGVLRRIREESPRSIREINPDIPEWLERIVGKLLAKSPDQRLSSAMEVAELLERCLAHVQQPTSVPLPQEIGSWPLDVISTETAAKPPRRRITGRRLWAAAALVALFVSVFAMHLLPSLPHVDNRDRFLRELPAPSVEARLITGHLGWNGLQSELDAARSTIEQLEANAAKDLMIPSASDQDAVPNEPR